MGACAWRCFKLIAANIVHFMGRIRLLNADEYIDACPQT